MSSNRTVLVTGATGKVGRHVVAGLLDGGARVRALVRNPAEAGLPATVQAVRGDLTDPSTVAAAAEGADAAFLLWPDFSAAGADAAVGALAAHVAHVVHLSAAQLRHADALGAATPGVWADVERLVERSGVSATFVRAGGFAANTLQWAGQIRVGDDVEIPFPQAGRSLVHERDIADVAVHALLDPRHRGRAYAVTGPETLTQAEQVAAIGAAIGRPLRTVALAPDDARRELAEHMGAEYAESALAYWATLVDTPERATADVELVTGHPARSFATWARDHRDDFAAALG